MTGGNLRQTIQKQRRICLLHFFYIRRTGPSVWESMGGERALGRPEEAADIQTADIKRGN